MTENEIELIYNYLHENYEYRDGSLLRNKDGRGFSKQKKGDELGSFFYQSDQQPRIRCTLNIKGKDYTKNLSHLIYLFHYKSMPDVIDYLDGNPTNCRIDNLKIGSRIASQAKKECRGWKPYTSSTGLTRYRVTLQIGKAIKVHFGSCETPDEARAVYDMAKRLYVVDRLEADDIKKKVMLEFPDIKMKLKKDNKHGFPGIYKRGNRFVARHNGLSSTHDTPEEAYKDVIRMKNGEFTKTNRLKTSDHCTKPGCDKPYSAKGLCNNHYIQFRRAQDKRIRFNKTGFVGVKFDKGKYSSRFNNKHLGMFKTPEEAHAAYLKAKEEYIK